MYESFSSGLTGKHWKRIGIRRRSGVTVPLFSIYSKRSAGIGEIPDLSLLADWCRKCGLSVIQLLPINDAGFRFTPYDAESSFALDPMHLSLNRAVGIPASRYRREVKALREKFPVGKKLVDYGIKAAKLELLREMFTQSGTGSLSRKNGDLSLAFATFLRANRYWLWDYALFKVLKEKFQGASWEDWPHEFKFRDPRALKQFEANRPADIQFHEWLQWQLFEQMKAARKDARKRGVFLMGDLPFLVSRDSADVWAHPNLFKLHLSGGAPPDAYFAKGQRWGMPPYDWNRVAAESYEYLVRRLRYAEHFYDLFRIDHVIGFFRLWTIPLTEPLENGGVNGSFDPPDERVWEEHGRALLSIVIQDTKMLPCAEDLGVVPECSYRVLADFVVPGTDVQRWTRAPELGFDFLAPASWRENSMAVISTHDMPPFRAWWEYEAGTVDELFFKRKLDARGISLDEVREKLFNLPESGHERLRWKEEITSAARLAQILNRPEHELRDIVDTYLFSYREKERFWSFAGLKGRSEKKCSQKLVNAALKKISETASVFSLQLVQDWLALGGVSKGDSWEERINFPGIVSGKNWAYVLPVPLEKLKALALNREIKSIHLESGRI